MSDYFLKPAQDLVARVEVGREGYCAVYPEPGSELLYTVCLVPTSDAETCPLIVYNNASHCCVCGSAHCEDALGVNTSVRLTPADANWPGIRSCVVVSQSALTLDCFVQRTSSEVTSLRQFTGSISYYARNSSAPTNETLSTSEVDQKLIIALPLAGALMVCIMVCILIILVLSLLLHREKHRNVQNASEQTDEAGPGAGKRVDGGGFKCVCVHACMCVCVHSCMCVCVCVCACTVAFHLFNPLPLFSLSALSSLAPGSANAKDVAARPVDFGIVTNFIPKMAPKWDVIGIQLGQADLVRELRHSNDLSVNCTRVLEAAMGSECLPNYKTLVKILNSAGVGLSQVATDMLKAVVDAEKDRELVQHPADSDSQPPPPSTSLDISESASLINNATT